MRPLQIVALLLIAASVFVLWKRPPYTTRQNVIELGDFKASVDERESIPVWLGAVGVGAGVVLLLAAGRKR
ncbi:MAG: hypothetical protein AAB011_00085 [Candidatus Eisenbacteria bacterium]